MGDVASQLTWRTWANAVTLARLAALPLFLWLLFGTGHRALAAWLLGVLGATDWVDGYVARRFNQVSSVGKILDPVADRVLVVTALVAVAAAAGVPWWFALATLAREVVVSVSTLILALMGAARIDVLWWGKVSTFALMTTYPLFLLTSNDHHAALATWQHWARGACWGIGLAGLTLSWLVLVGYVGPASRALRTGRVGRVVE